MKNSRPKNTNGMWWTTANIFWRLNRSQCKGNLFCSGYGLHFYSLINAVMEGLPDDTVVYFLHHVQKTDYGIKAKTIGKMLDDQLTVEDCFQSFSWLSLTMDFISELKPFEIR